MRSPSSQPRRHLTALASLTALLLLGCSGGNEVPLFPAQGKLTVAGLPAEGALVTLIPEGDAEPEVRPAGRVDSAGVFNIHTYDPDTQTTKKGARPGAYIALVTWVPDPTDSNLEMGVRDRLGNRYRNKEASQFRFEIKEGAPELPPIDLPKTDLVY